jgi:hypothetical protein
MVPHSDGSANQDLSWASLTGKRELRGSGGIGRHVACWIADNLGYVVVSMVPIAKAGGRKQPYETWGDAKPGREAGVASEYRTPLEIMRAKYFRLKCGVGILAGKSGLVCIDIDNEDSWNELCAGRELPRTMEFSTLHGRHIVFRDETGISFKSQQSQLAPGVDVRGRGGLFVVYDPGQPERHPTDLHEPAELPDWLRAAIPRTGSRGYRKGGKGKPPPKVDIAEIMRGIPPGQHHERLRAASMSIVNYDLNFSDSAWFDMAVSILERSNEGTDGKGNVRDLYTDEEIMGYLHSAQEKRRGELAARKADPAIRYRGAQIVQSAADVPDKDVEWIWERYIPRCVLTQVDGEKTVGKTTSYADIVARATTGRAMPGEEEAICDPLNVFIFTEELPTINKKKLRAAGADLSRVFYPHPEFRDAIARMIEENEKDVAKAEDDEEEDFDYLLPTGVDLILEMIRSAQAELVIWDPISNYFDTRKADVNSDASVRRALEPLVQGIEQMNAAGVMFRHMNKDRNASARHRGSGTTAFQNIGRVHLVMGRLPADYTEDGEYGLAMIANNYTVAVKGTLTFDVVDSDVKLDNRGNMIGKIVWHDIDEDMDAETLVRGSRKADDSSGKPGPTPHKTIAIKRILLDMGKEKPVWDASEGMAHVMEEMEKLGFDKPNRKMVDRARGALMITSRSRPGAVGLNDWHWPAQLVPRARA